METAPRQIQVQAETGGCVPGSSENPNYELKSLDNAAGLSGTELASNNSQSSCTISHSIKTGMQLWLRIALRSTPEFTIVVLFMVLFYAPARLMSQRVLDVARPFLYSYVRSVFSISTLYMSFILTSVDVYGWEISKGVILFGILPFYLIRMAHELVSSLGFLAQISFMGSVIDLAGVIVGMWLIRQTKKPTLEPIPPNVAIAYELTKDGTPMALLKGLVGVFALTVFVLVTVFPIYLESDLAIQLVFRFLLLPLIFVLSIWLQYIFIFHLSPQHMERRLVVLKICIRFVHFIGRLTLSSLSSADSISAAYVSVNISVSLFTCLWVVFHNKRVSILFRVKRWTLSAISYILSKRATKVINMSDIHSADANTPPSEQHIFNEESAYVQHSLHIQTKQLMDDISTEIHALILAPLLMYSIYPVYPETPFQVLSSFAQCMYQILIQLLFEFLADVTCLSYFVHKGVFTSQSMDEWRPLNSYLLVIFSIFCLLHTHYYMGVFSSQ